MLAKTIPSIQNSGVLAPDIQPKGLSLRVVLEFVERELPNWRDDADRPKVTAETALTSNLAAYLTQSARHAGGLDILQFRTEVPDEVRPGRTIDLAPAPCNAIVWVDGRRCTYSDILMPIECKRLPTPEGANRDEREYVFSGHSTTGGIQRFKAGHHGAAHLLGAMIGYIQTDSAPVWYERVTSWIEELAVPGGGVWSRNDLLYLEGNHSSVSRYRSLHSRQNSLQDIELQHFWIEMDNS